MDHQPTSTSMLADSTIKLKLHRRSAAVLTLLACLSALFCLKTDSGVESYFDGNDSGHLQETSRELISFDEDFDRTEFTVCGRKARSAPNVTSALRQKLDGSCPKYDRKKPMLFIRSHQVYGRTGNHMREFLNAIQYARDHNIQLGMEYDSWAMETLSSMFMVRDGFVGDWIHRMEKTLCVKVFRATHDVRPWGGKYNLWDASWMKQADGHRKIKPPDFMAKALFYYHSFVPQEEYVSNQLYTLQKLFQNYNKGAGRNWFAPVQDMCSGINKLFGQDRTSEIYSAIHLRQQEEFGKSLLAMAAGQTGCDPEAAMEMQPEYVKSILGPLGMLEHPIVVITDGQSPVVLNRLLQDPDIGHKIRVVQEDDSWLGGDVTSAVMANVFIGNPASTMSKFIAMSRVALGFGGSNYLWRAKDESGKWTTVCGDECLFRRKTDQVHIHGDWPQEMDHPDHTNVFGPHHKWKFPYSVKKL